MSSPTEQTALLATYMYNNKIETEPIFPLKWEFRNARENGIIFFGFLILLCFGQLEKKNVEKKEKKQKWNEMEETQELRWKIDQHTKCCVYSILEVMRCTAQGPALHVWGSTNMPVSIYR